MVTFLLCLLLLYVLFERGCGCMALIILLVLILL